MNSCRSLKLEVSFKKLCWEKRLGGGQLRDQTHVLKKTHTGSYDLDPLEKGIIKLINQYPSIIKEAGDSLSPALIANYVYELAKEFNHFYQSLPILKLDDEQIAAFRINLAETTGRVIKSAMNLLGIDVPDQM